MFQILDIKLPAGVEKDGKVVPGKLVIDDQLKSEYKGGITGLTLWTENSVNMRQIEIELTIDNEEVFPAGFPAELFSSNQFRNTQPLQLSFPKESKIEGLVKNFNKNPVDVSLIFYVKLKE